MKSIIAICFLALSFSGYSQNFISKGKIEYEVKINNLKNLPDGAWADAIRDKAPKFSTTYYDLYFNGSKSTYKFNRYDEASKFNFMNSNLEDNIWYSDFNSSTFVQQKFIFDGLYLISDSLSKLQWKLVPNETREIAGFLCRKAVATLFDSVYVFAFYTDEIVTPGGPMSMHGLPGMILGITIPRLYTSWIATKVQVISIDDKMIAIPTKGKKKKAIELQKQLEGVLKDAGAMGQKWIWKIFI